MKKLNKIVLIDDSDSTNQLNIELLKNLDISNEVISFTNAKDALSFLKDSFNNNDIPELVLLDLVMPEMNGFSFLEKYIDSAEFKAAKFEPNIVILSDHLDFKNFTKSKNYKTYGVIDHLRKPIEKIDIEELLEEHFA